MIIDITICGNRVADALVSYCGHSMRPLHSMGLEKVGMQVVAWEEIEDERNFLSQVVGFFPSEKWLCT